MSRSWVVDRGAAVFGPTLVMLCLFLFGPGAGLAHGQEEAGREPVAIHERPAASRDPRVEKAIRLGCEYLVSQQQETVGAWGDADRLALTSMATLGLMSTGSTPRRGPYSKAVLEAVRWVLDRQRPKGHFWDDKSGYSQIHNHGYALLLLTQVYGEGGPEIDGRIALSIPRAVKATEESQHRNGGFGYFLYLQPPPGNEMYTGDEASTTISQIQALRGARNAGFTISDKVITSAERYIFRSQHAPTGGFIYSLKNGRVSFLEGSDTPTFAITAASACVLNSLGTYRGPNLERAIDYFEAFAPPSKKTVSFFYYGHYYAAQVMYQIGGERGRRWREKIVAELLKRQQADGSFPESSDSHVKGSAASILHTSWAVQILAMDQGALPIFQR